MSESWSAIGRRVVVTGLAGSGKSTFAVALAVKTGLPVVHLDLAFWNPGWVGPSETEWRDKQCVVLAGDAWFAEGNYHETLDLRIQRADTLVVLDSRGGSVQGARSGVGFGYRANCLKVATTRPGPGCAMSGAWRVESGGSAT